MPEYYRPTGRTSNKTREKDKPPGPAPTSNNKDQGYLHADPTTSEPTIQTDYGVVSAPDYYQNLQTIEQHSNSKLPTDVTLYLAGLGGDHKKLVRTAQVFAKRFDVSPKYIFGSTDPKDFVNPVTGEPLSLKDAQRITDNFAAVPLSGMINAAVKQRIADMTRGGSNNYKGGSTREASQGGEAHIDQKKVQEWAKVISTHGGDMPLDQGIGLAVWLASQPHLSTQKFKHNVELAQRWWATQSTRSTPIDPQMILSIAIDATRDGKSLKSMNDVEDAVFGEGSAINHDFAKFLSTSTQVLGTPKQITLMDLPELGPDYWKDVNSIAASVALDQQAFSHSAFGKLLAGVGWVGSQMWVATEKALVEVGFAIEKPVTFALAPVLGKNPADVHRYMQELHNEEITRLNQGEDVGDWVEEGYSNVTEHYAGFRLPSWTSTAFDFAVGWYVDPTVVYGKAGRVLRGEEAITGLGKGYSFASRIMPGLESPTVGKQILESIPGIGRVVAHDRALTNDILQQGFQRYVTNLPDSRVAGKILESIYTGTDNTALLRTLDLYTPGRNLTRTLDYEYMKLLSSKLKEVFPVLNADAKAAFGEALRAHFAQAVPEDSIAAWVVKARETRAQGQVAKAGITGVTPEPNELAIALSNHLASGGENAIPFTLEGPARLGAYGPRSLFRKAVTSEFSTQTALGKRGAQVFNVNPGRVLNMHEADEYFVLHMRRWGAFDEQAVRKVQSQIFEAKSRGYMEFRNPVTGAIERKGYEDAVDALMNSVNSDAIDYILRDMNVTDAAALKLKKDLLDPIIKQNQEAKAFMVLPGAEGEKVITSPMLETQRVNFRYVVDPVQVRREIREYTTLPRRLQNHLAKAFDSESLALSIGGKIDRNAFDRFLVSSGHHIEDIWSWRKRAWKSLTIARPGYIPRVILLDENARFLFTTRSLTERLMSQEWFGLTNKLSEHGIGTRAVDFSGETVKMPLPGTYDRIPGAVGNIRQSEQIEEMLKRGRQGFQRYGPKGFGPVSAADNEVEHLAAWRWALDKQIKGGAAGKVGLAKMAETGNIADVRAALVKWAEDDHFVVLTKRIGVSPADFDNWFDEMSQGIFAYTAGSKKIAADTLLLSGKELDASLEAIPVGNRPTVHGPGIEALTQGGGYQFGNEFTNFMYEWTVRQPEALFNRFPYARAMKRRSEIAYYDFLKSRLPERIGPTRLEDLEIIPPRTGTTAPDRRLDASSIVAERATGDADGYLYSLSPTKNQFSIQNIGLQPTTTTSVSEDLIPEFMRGKRLFFADSIDRARELAHSATSEQLAFRVKASDIGDVFPEQSFSGSWFTRNTIPSTKVEALGKDGTWSVIGTEGQHLTPEIRNAVDIASTNFALERVRAVMFDLTRQSRFTELLQIVFPFPQPFFEGFQTWGAIAMRHPETVGRTMQLFRTGVESGFIHKDETSGEYVVPLPAYRQAAMVLSALGVGPEAGKLDGLAIHMSAPLSSFNLLASSTIKFGGGGFIGKMIGGVPIPAPGADPAFALLGQFLLAKRSDVPVTSYLFQYGPSSPLSLLPTPVKSALTALGFEGLIPDSQRKSLTYSILRTYQVEGLDRRSDGSIIPLDELQAMAEHDANELLEFKAAYSMFSPASPRIKTGASPYEAEFQDIVDSSPTFTDAIDTWIKRHPTLSYIAVGKTFYDAGIKGPNGEELHAPRIPASQVVDELMKQPGIGDFMKANPAWAGLVLIGLDPKVLEAQDFGVYSKQLTEGLVKYRPLDEYLAAGENVKVMGILDDWYTNVWDPARSGITDTSSPEYRILITKRAQELSFLAQQYPNWATTHLVAKGEGENLVYEFPMGGDRPYDLAVAQARRMADTPGFENAPGFQALGKYLEIRDDIAGKMEKAGITDIMLPSDDAERLRKQFASKLADLEAETPGITPFVSAYFGVHLTKPDITDAELHGALGGLQSTGYDLEFSGDLRSLPNAYIKKIEKMPPELQDQVIRVSTHYQTMRSDADRDYTYAWEKSQNYQTAQSYLDHKFLNQPEVLKAWWSTMTVNERNQYKADLATKPTIFYSAWDWKQQGVNLPEVSVRHLEQVAEWRIGIQRKELEAAQSGEDFSSGDYYASIDAHVNEWAKKNKKFADAVDKINSWTFGLRAAGYGDHPNKDKANEYWAWLLDAADGIQTNVDTYNKGQSSSNQLHGFGTFTSKEDKATWQGQRDWLLDWAGYFRKKSDAFNTQWLDLQENNQDPIIGALILPDTYYRLGG